MRAIPLMENLRNYAGILSLKIGDFDRSRVDKVSPNSTYRIRTSHSAEGVVEGVTLTSPGRRLDLVENPRAARATSLMENLRNYAGIFDLNIGDFDFSDVDVAGSPYEIRTVHAAGVLSEVTIKSPGKRRVTLFPKRERSESSASSTE